MNRKRNYIVEITKSFKDHRSRVCSKRRLNRLKYDDLTARSFRHVVFYDNIVRPSDLSTLANVKTRTSTRDGM